MKTTTAPTTTATTNNNGESGEKQFCLQLGIECRRTEGKRAEEGNK